MMICCDEVFVSYSRLVQLIVMIAKTIVSVTSPIPPTEQYVNQSSPVALEGSAHKLHCFFSG